jgi:hypothetical protein
MRATNGGAAEKESTELQTRVGKCRVCVLLDGDYSDKECGYCSFCDAWICAADRFSVARRIRAGLAERCEPGNPAGTNYARNDSLAGRHFVMKVCEVCKRLDGDETLKECEYCAIC